MVASPLTPKCPILIPFFGLDHQKSKFLLVSCNLDVGGCWGQPILLFWKLFDETQVSNLLKPLGTVKNIWSFYPSEPFSLTFHFDTSCKIFERLLIQISHIIQINVKRHLIQKYNSLSIFLTILLGILMFLQPSLYM